ncbi:type II toxin-antitoxin system HicB family antitoxin [Lactobacillus gasseri]|jgi:predicted RNase H-like HicB family nuclease|uniref:HicB-like antitoxin of toxin-antitoxin system domain-containing protein n=2 Tax=Lactobacillus gasseri TaxID=1596 RepID=A0ABY3BGG2_LACGS|nr:type II toxin-antitoxin system HicB family antitoxin [Lactobacillus gasseri]KFL96339.1 toxin-antitoxin system, antitoxin component, HicB family [Lactobacillus gasseri SV-16A-US]MCT7894918.1 type II toxin-antitoxin system HicB family antitoxin [Lactobacillus gasseri]MCZ3760952.1 type II toxin-antitoxin system HicB family antitoxin [Lactobacillus gasseri]MCZ3762735.1 type II toxin-antitoxin system HicB family antitoxin [Lactobacillus gasseri]MCZ3766252.1 type II toxin-antitoxin system HicB fa
MVFVVYPAILDDSENEKEYYTVTFPDVTGAITDGNGEGEAMARGSEILGAFLYDLPKDQLPVPTDIEVVRRNNPDKLVVPIFADLEKARRETKPATVKKNTTIPGDLAYKAEEAGINFSQTLTEALKKKLNL